MHDDLKRYLDSLEKGDSYRVEAVLKENSREITERVYLIGADGSERGPFIRKRFSGGAGTGAAYERIYEAQTAGKRFMHIPKVIECSLPPEIGREVVVEYVVGQSLEDLIASEGASFDLAARVFPLVCDAVTELHTRFDPPLIHRDIKPDNVIVSQETVTLIDFGVARSFSNEATRDTNCFGTRDYAPPEQFGYGQTDVRSDVYALGMLLYRCVTGKRPGAHSAAEGFAEQEIPEVLRSVLAQATAFDPADRYASVEELKQAFCVARGVVASGLTAPTPPPYPAEAKDAPAVSHIEQERLADRIPRWLGVIWNLLVLAFWLLLVAAACVAVFFPNPDPVPPPLEQRVVVGFGIFAIAPAFLAYLLLDKRGIRKRVPAIAHLTWRQEVPRCLLLCVATVAVAIIACMLMASMALLG